MEGFILSLLPFLHLMTGTGTDWDLGEMWEVGKYKRLALFQRAVPEKERYAFFLGQEAKVVVCVMQQRRVPQR